MLKSKSKQNGFTIIELLVVIVVIGILAAISVVSYVGITNKAIVSLLSNDLTNAAKKIQMYYVQYDSYPNTLADADIPNPDNRITYYNTSSGATKSYSLTAKKNDISYYVSSDSTTPKEINKAVITIVDGYKIYTFNTSGAFQIPSSPSNIDLLVVAGGGAAGDSIYANGGPGGGGAGGLIYNLNYPIDTMVPIEVTVGAGGLVVTNSSGANGADSSFGPIIAKGGGGGARPGLNGVNGGSGGGGGYNGYSTTVIKNGGTGESGQGNSGGMTNVQSYYGAGGGGAGGVGGNTTLSGPGSRGAGMSINISGSSVTYSTGGKGGSSSGSVISSPNLGKGGDGGYGGATRPSYAGGSGVVIVRYKL